VFPTTFKLDLAVVFPDKIIVPPTGWRSKTWLNPVPCLMVCIFELVVAVGGDIPNWNCPVYDEPSTILIPSFVIPPFTFNVLFIVVILFNVVGPDTFNDDINVTLL